MAWSHCVVLGGLAIALLATSVEVGAAPVPLAAVSAAATIYEGGTPLASQNDSVQTEGTDSVDPLEARASFGGEIATSWASVTDGLLHAYASVTSPVPFDARYGFASASAYYSDFITIVSTTLAFGTPVQVRFDVALDSQVTACPQNAETSAAAFVTLSAGPGLAFIQNDDCSLDDFYEPTALVDTTIGAEFQVWMSLSVQAGADAGNGTADAGHTAAFFVTSLGDFDYVMASGNRFDARSVPESASLLLMTTGIAVIGWRARRRR